MRQDHLDLSIRRQCSLLALARSSLYYQPRNENAGNLAFMEIIGRQFLGTHWYGSRQPLGRLLCNRLPANEWPVICNGKGTNAGVTACGG